MGESGVSVSDTADQVAAANCRARLLAVVKRQTFASYDFGQLLGMAKSIDADPGDIESSMGKVLGGKLQSIPRSTLVRILSGRAAPESYGYWAACEVKVIESVDLPNAAIGSKVWLPVGSLDRISPNTKLYVTGTPVVIRKGAFLYPDLATLRMHRMGEESPQAITAYGHISWFSSPTRVVIADRVIVGEWIGYRVLKSPVPPQCAALDEPGCESWWIDAKNVEPTTGSKWY